jgi:hypothetical protein
MDDDRYLKTALCYKPKGYNDTKIEKIVMKSVQASTHRIGDTRTKTLETGAHSEIYAQHV